MLCNDGQFEPPTWPEETACAVVQTCTPPTPDSKARFKPITVTEVADGNNLYFVCEDPEAILSDGSNLNAYTLTCDGEDWKVGDAAFDPDSFPKCLSICKDTDIGDKFTYVPPSGVDEATIVIRTGDLADWECADGYYVEGTSDYTRTTVQKECQSDGTFPDQIEKCRQIPCDQADIEAVTPVEGDFVTIATGETPVNTEIQFTCTDDTKVVN